MEKLEIFMKDESVRLYIDNKVIQMIKGDFESLVESLIVSEKVAVEDDFLEL